MHLDKARLSEISEMLKQQNDMPLLSTYGTIADHKIFNDLSHDAIIGQLQASSLSEQHYKKREALSKFRETYIKLRTDNIVLDHRTAIEMAKMIYQEADTITYADL